MAESTEADIMFLDLEDESQDMGAVAPAPPAEEPPPDDEVAGGVFSVAAIRATQIAAWLAEKYDLDPAPLRDPLQTFIIRRRRSGLRKSDLNRLVEAADRELSRVEHALPSISRDAQVRLLTTHGFDHGRAIVDVIQSKLDARISKAFFFDRSQLEKAIKVPVRALRSQPAHYLRACSFASQRAFRRAVVAKCPHPCLEAVKTLNTQLLAEPEVA